MKDQLLFIILCGRIAFVPFFWGTKSNISFAAKGYISFVPLATHKNFICTIAKVTFNAIV